MSEKVVAEGERVFLAMPTEADAEAFVRAVEITENLHYPWVSPPSNREKYTAYLERTDTESQEGFLVKLKGSGQLAGVININNIVRGAFQSGYLGFYAFSGCEGQGFMTDGLSLVLSHAFKALGLHRLEANIQPDNSKSIALVKKHGFRHEGFSPAYLNINGAWQDHERYAITAELYSSVRII